MSTPKQPVINAVLITYINYSITENYIGKMASFLPYTQSGASPQSSASHLSACDFFLWGYLKSKVYVRKPRTVDDLKVSIREEIATVSQEMLVNVMQSFEERLQTCVRQEGRHLSDIIFRNWVINISNQNCIYYRFFWCWHNFLYWK